MNILRLRLLKKSLHSKQAGLSTFGPGACTIPLSGLAFTLALAQGAFGQGITGSITGNVIDASRTSVAGATVTVRQADTDLTRTVTTSDNGSFVVTQLAPGKLRCNNRQNWLQDLSAKQHRASDRS